MKNFCVIFTAPLFPNLQLQAQTHNALSYRGVAGDATGLVLPNKLVEIGFTIHQGLAGGAITYRETQATAANLLGLFLND